MVGRSYSACTQHLHAAVFAVTEAQDKPDIVAQIKILGGKDKLFPCDAPECTEMAWYFVAEHQNAYVDEEGTLRVSPWHASRGTVYPLADFLRTPGERSH